MANNSRRVQFQTNLHERIVADTIGCLDRIDNINRNYDNKLEPALESLSETFALNNEDVLHPTSLKSIMGFQQKDKSLIEIANEKYNNYSIEQFHGAGKTYSLISQHRKIMIPKQIQKSLVKCTTTYYATHAKPGPN